MKTLFRLLLFFILFSQMAYAAKFDSMSVEGSVFIPPESNGIVIFDHSIPFSGNQITYAKGVTEFGENHDGFYIHFVDANHGFLRWGGKNVRNTFPFTAECSWICFVKNDLGMPMHLIEGRNADPKLNHQILLGKRKDGTWVKLIDTKELTKKYFGQDTEIYYDMAFTGYEKKDTLYIRYRKSLERREDGRFEFVWNNNIQGFDVKHIIR